LSALRHQLGGIDQAIEEAQLVEALGGEAEASDISMAMG